MLKIENITKTYYLNRRKTAVLKGIDINLEPGTFTAITGPSGCGKSTLMLIIGALLQPDSGTVMIDDVNLLAMPPGQQAKKRVELIGFVFQRFHLMPYLTVEENILTASIAVGNNSNNQSRLNELMEMLGIIDRRDHLPSELSVGEMQRTALARALFNKPKIILADEPTGNLDPDNAKIVMKTFTEFTQAGGTVLMVTHNPAEAAQADCCHSIEHGIINVSKN
jgi:ABC-type lipoprotein export system ATPase subunit